MQSTEDSLLQLSEMLQLSATPARIEAFDISHTQGTNTVASCIVFDEGQPVPSEYHTYRIPQLDQAGAPNDYFSLQEAVKRRFKAPAPAGRSKRKRTPTPDVLLIDGG